MALSAQELLGLADQRIAEAQHLLNPVEKPASVVFHAHHSSDILRSLSDLQCYIDRAILDNGTFPWEVHWAPHLTEHPAEKRSPPASLDASRARINEFIETYSCEAQSLAVSQRGTMEHFRLGVLVLVTQLVQKLVRHRGTPATVGLPMEPAVAPSDVLGGAAVQASPDGAAGVALPKPPASGENPYNASDDCAAQERPSTARTSMPQSRLPNESSQQRSNQTPEALRTIVDGVEYVSVDMRIANTVCRPNSARTLAPAKPPSPRVVAMVRALERNARWVNTRDEAVRTKSTAPAAPHVNETSASLLQEQQSLQSSTTKPSIRRTHRAPPAVALEQEPLSGSVSVSSPRISVIAYDAAWGSRNRRSHQVPSRWVLARKPSDGSLSSVGVSETVCVTAAVPQRPSDAAAAAKDATFVTGTWAPNHDSRWVAPS